MLPLAGAFALAVTLHRVDWRWRWGTLLALVVLTAGLAETAAVEQVLVRFETAAEDARFVFWHNTLAGVRGTMPLGIGFGAFAGYYPLLEHLEEVQPWIPNHAHNDYLELLLEGGVPAVLIIAAALALGVATMVGRLQRPGSRTGRAMTVGAVGGLLVILLHSLDDYPLRMTAIEVLAGVLAAMQFAPVTAAPVRTAPRGRRVVRWTGTTGLIVGLIVASQSIASAVAVRLEQRDPAASTRWTPWAAGPWAAR